MHFSPWLILIVTIVLISCNRTIVYQKTNGFVDVVRDCDVNQNIDSTIQLKECLANIKSNSTLYFAPGKYLFNAPLTVSENYVTLTTSSYGAAELEYSGCGAALSFTRGDLPIYQSGIKYIRLKGSGLCAKTAVVIVDGRRFSIHDMEIIDFSVGVKTQGRERFNLRDTQITADYPVVFGKNPNHSNIDVDHAVFHNLYCIITGNNYCITIEDGVTVTNLVTTGSNAVAKGCGIIKWITTELPEVVSQNVKIANVRSEQNQPGCDRPIYIDLTGGRQLQNLIIDNVRLGGPFARNATGIYTRNVQSMTVRNSTYANNTPSVFIDGGGAEYIELQNNFSYLTSDIVTGLTWIDGPFRGKDCCIDGLKSIVSGKLSK